MIFLNAFARSIIDLFKKKIKNFSQHVMMESLTLDKENIINDIRNLFRLKKDLTTLQLKIAEIN